MRCDAYIKYDVYEQKLLLTQEKYGKKRWGRKYSAFIYFLIATLTHTEILKIKNCNKLLREKRRMKRLCERRKTKKKNRKQRIKKLSCSRESPFRSNDFKTLELTHNCHIKQSIQQIVLLCCYKML